MQPWDGEPDDLEWIDPLTGYTCLILRHLESKHLCGYVKLPKGHVLYKKEYSGTIPPCLFATRDALNEAPIGKRGMIDVFCGGDRLGILVDVHGSVTFSGELRDKDGWWWGFDCAHYMDYSQYSRDGVYRDIEYVKSECTSMAKQLKEINDAISSELED